MRWRWHGTFATVDTTSGKQVNLFEEHEWHLADGAPPDAWRESGNRRFRTSTSPVKRVDEPFFLLSDGTRLRRV